MRTKQLGYRRALTRRPEQIIETAAAADRTLNNEDIEEIEQLLAERMRQIGKEKT